MDWTGIDDSESAEGDDPVDFDAGDLLGKVLTLINQASLCVLCGTLGLIVGQIHALPQAKAYFATVCQEEGLKPLELVK